MKPQTQSPVNKSKCVDPYFLTISLLRTRLKFATRDAQKLIRDIDGEYLPIE